MQCSLRIQICLPKAKIVVNVVWCVTPGVPSTPCWCFCSNLTFLYCCEIAPDRNSASEELRSDCKKIVTHVVIFGNFLQLVCFLSLCTQELHLAVHILCQHLHAILVHTGHPGSHGDGVPRRWGGYNFRPSSVADFLSLCKWCFFFSRMFLR